MSDVKGAIKTALVTLAVIYVMNQLSITRPLVQRALIG